MEANMEKAHLLIHQSRWDLAEKELRGILAQNPDDYRAHSLLALSLVRQGKKDEALSEAKTAIGMEPGAPYAHYIMALALLEADRPKEARASIEESIRLDPEDADYFSLLGWLQLDEKDAASALANAEKGLAIDAAHVHCANLRAAALVRLGRGKEAGHTLDTALSEEPDNALTHANLGWTRLEGRDHKQAMEHFREALRLDPTMEWAREGIVEAMKARNPIYRTMLRYFFWASKLSSKAQMGLVIGAIFLMRGLRAYAKQNPEFQPVATTVTIAYFVFMIASWLARPFFDLMLRFDRFGRLCLSEDQIKGSNLIGGALLLGAVFAGTSFVLDNGTLLIAGAGCLALCLPLSGIYQAREEKRRRIVAGVSIALAIAGVGALLLPAPIGPICGGAFLLGIIAYTWLAAL